MNTVEKGDSLEQQLYEFLLEQKRRDDWVYQVYPAKLCKISKKKKYHCRERNGDVEFDVVLEIFREEGTAPHNTVVFECKNHKASVHEREITDFSHKLGRIFGHAAKGVFVSASRLQSGAANVAKSRGIGIVKFDVNGMEIIADRTVRPGTRSSLLNAQVFEGARRTVSLKFSAYDNGKYFSSLPQLLTSFDKNPEPEKEEQYEASSGIVPYVSESSIEKLANIVLSNIDYHGGKVDLGLACRNHNLTVVHSDKFTFDNDGNAILGSMKFDEMALLINKHNNQYRERFTIAHELGHFVLGHGDYLRSDTVLEKNLLIADDSSEELNYERLEYQANIFASLLLLPRAEFMIELELQRKRLNYIDKGFGYIFVDDQPCNYALYNEFISALSDHFSVSKQAVDIRVKQTGLVNDQRKHRY